MAEVRTHPPCTGKPDPAVSEHNCRERTERRRLLFIALESGPATIRELRDRIGVHEWHPTFFWGADCRGHLTDETRTTPYGPSDLANDLHWLQRQGVVERVVMAGWKAQLWTLRVSS